MLFYDLSLNVKTSIIQMKSYNSYLFHVNNAVIKTEIKSNSKFIDNLPVITFLSLESTMLFHFTSFLIFQLCFLWIHSFNNVNTHVSFIYKLHINFQQLKSFHGVSLSKCSLMLIIKFSFPC